MTAKPLTYAALAISTCIATSAAHATGLDDLQQLMSEMEGDNEMHLLGIVEEETSIATRSKLNSDYVPGIVTILRGEVSHARGATTVSEALSLVPGIEMTHDRLGNQAAIIRGVGGIFGSGNMKILVNDISLNHAITGHAEKVLSMPIEQIERIEVIRGPGAALYGEFSFAGVVNIITHKEKTAAFVGGGSFGKRSLSMVLNPMPDDSPLKLSLNLAAWQRDDTGTQAGEDALYNGTNGTLSQGAVSNAPGPINDEKYFRSALFNLNYYNFNLQAQAIDGGHGDHFGAFDALPTPDEDITNKGKTRTIELSQSRQLNSTLSSKVTIGWQRHDNIYDFSIVPAGYLVGWGWIGVPEYPNGWDANGYYREERLYGSLDIHWNGWQNHQILASLSAKNIDVKEAWQWGNVNPVTTYPVTGDPLPELFTGSENWINENKQRDIRSLVLQDEYSFSDRTTYTLGVRYDDYDDVGYNIAPRLAGVFRQSDEHIFKGQYAEAFRPPSFHEEWNSTASSIEPDIIRTLELGYIHRLWNRVDRITLSHSRLEDLIIFEGLLDYKNLHDVRVNSVELETERYLLDWVKLNANISYSDAENTSLNEPIAGAAKLLSTIGLMMSRQDSSTLSLDLHYVGERQRESQDSRQDMGSYFTVDSTLSYTPSGSMLTLRLGIKNLLDREVRYPASLTWDNIGSNFMESYADDYPQPGRSGWVQLGYQF